MKFPFKQITGLRNQLKKTRENTQLLPTEKAITQEDIIKKLKARNEKLNFLYTEEQKKVTGYATHIKELEKLLDEANNEYNCTSHELIALKKESESFEQVIYSE